MGAMSRAKGQRGEREVFGLLSDLLGTVIKRNVNARKGDCDSFEIPGWAPESKWCEEWKEMYWAQAVQQAAKINRRPVLFLRQTRKPWVAMVDLADIVEPRIDLSDFTVLHRGHRVSMSLEAFADLYRERLT